MEQVGQPREIVEDNVHLDLVEGEERYSSLQLFFLRRLSRLLQVRQQQAGQLNGEGLRLLDGAIFSTYCDCVDLGLGQEAQRVVQRLTVGSHSQPEN